MVVVIEVSNTIFDIFIPQKEKKSNKLRRLKQNNYLCDSMNIFKNKDRNIEKYAT